MQGLLKTNNMDQEEKKIVSKPVKTEVKFLKGNQMGVTVGTVVSVNTAYAEKCVKEEWAELYTAKK